MTHLNQFRRHYSTYISCIYFRSCVWEMMRGSKQLWSGTNINFFSWFQIYQLPDQAPTWMPIDHLQWGWQTYELRTNLDWNSAKSHWAILNRWNDVTHDYKWGRQNNKCNINGPHVADSEAGELSSSRTPDMPRRGHTSAFENSICRQAKHYITLLTRQRITWLLWNLQLTTLASSQHPAGCTQGKSHTHV